MDHSLTEKMASMVNVVITTDITQTKGGCSCTVTADMVNCSQLLHHFQLILVSAISGLQFQTPCSPMHSNNTFPSISLSLILLDQY